MARKETKEKVETVALYDVSEQLLKRISEAKRAIMEQEPTKRNVTNTEAINYITFGTSTPPNE